MNTYLDVGEKESKDSQCKKCKQYEQT